MYGTCVRFTSAIAANNAPPRCVELPVPADGYRMEPGLALATAISSPTLLIGNAGFTATTNGDTPTIDTGEKSRTES